ncbi:MAG: DUF1330 domain-containing protein [Actinomycetota bacterium]
MQVTNQTWPTDPEQIAAMQEDGPEGPIYMVNLLTFKERAEYEDGRASDLSGEAAYQLYGAGVAGLIQQYGGEIVFFGSVTHLSLGKVDDLWDQVAIAKYPNRRALWDMTQSPAYGEIAVHRTAGLEGQLNIETVGNPFA